MKLTRRTPSQLGTQPPEFARERVHYAAAIIALAAAIEADPMSDAAFDTVRMQHCVERWQAGDAAAADDLVRAICPRLEQIARKMLCGFQAIRGSAETADVLQ